jgi:Ca2+-binding RTX toxin-like protein
MKKTLLAALGAALVFVVLPALGAAAIQAPTFAQGNDYGQRSAVVNYPLPANADEGALVGPTVCLPLPGSTFTLGTTAVDCTSFADGGEICIPPVGCLPLPDVPVTGGFDVRVDIVRCTLAGDSGANSLGGTPEIDWICGRSGADILSGGDRADTLVGGGGPDRIKGGDGRDQVAAGRGIDTVKVRGGSRDTVSCGPGRDLVVADNRDVIARNCELVRLG